MMQAVQPVPTRSFSSHTAFSRQYTIDMIRDEARQLVYNGDLSRHQPILALCRCIPAREWVYLERELEDNGFLLRDQIIDLLGREDWSED